MSDWSNTVPLYEEDNSTEHEEMNKPLQALIDRTDYLKQQVDQVTAGENLIGTFVNLDSTTAVGDAVYVDAATGTVKPALSGFSTEFAQDGSFRLAESGYVLGIIIAKTNATSGRIWLSGALTDQAVADATLGGGALAGIYRLSMSEGGSLVIAEQELDILVVQYQGNGAMTMFDKRAAIPNHIHQTYVLNQAWLLDSDVAFDEMDKPVEATYGYDIANDLNMQRVFATVPGAVRIFGDGVLLAEVEVVGNEDNLWWVDAVTVPTDYTILEATITMPYTFGEPVLRGARTDTPTELELTADQGILTTNMKPWVTTDDTPDGTAILSLLGRAAKRTPVVTSLSTIGDLESTVNSKGGVTISLGQGINTFLEPQIVNLNNAIEVSDGYYVYYAIPAGRDASMIGRISLPYFPDTNLAAAVVAEVQGLSGGGAIPALAVSYNAREYASSAIALPSAWDGTLTLPTPAIAANTALITEAVIGDRFNVTSRGTIFLKLGFDTPSEDIKITRFGVILYTI